MTFSNGSQKKDKPEREYFISMALFPSKANLNTVPRAPDPRFWP